ncbi:MAG: hypothetical protein SFX73_04110 [Kofleriaceae bacterium]|nr:hypothetical protein [Kofleriaceae bacterium]
MTRTPALAYAPTCYQSKAPTMASAAHSNTARVTVRFQGVTYVLLNPANDADPCGALVKDGE